MKLDRCTNHISKTIQEFNRQCAQEQIKRIPTNALKKYQKRIQNYGIDMSCKIGEGTFSKVYKGKDMAEGGEVAVKIVELKKIREMGIQQLFWEELNIIKRLRHPNIVSCYEYFRTNNNCYTIYQFCETGDLSKRLKKGNLGDKQDISQANTIIKDVFQGLLYLQSMSIVHRDIKAANILLAKGKAKIGDFGFATHCKRQFKDVSIGSPAYMAPEGLVHNIYGPKTDVWAFGVLIYEILHGQTPFHHCQSQHELKQKVQMPVNWDQLRCSLPSQLKRLILKCLKVQFEQRPSFSQLLNDEYIQKIYQQCSTFRNITKSNFSKLTSDSQENSSHSPQNRNRERKSINPFNNNHFIQQKNNNLEDDLEKRYSNIHVKTQTNEEQEEEIAKDQIKIETFPQSNINGQDQTIEAKSQTNKQAVNPFLNLTLQKFTYLTKQQYTPAVLEQYIQIILIFKKMIGSHKQLVQQQTLHLFPQLTNQIIKQVYCKSNLLSLPQLKLQIQTQLPLQQVPNQCQVQQQNAEDISARIDEQLFRLIKGIELQIDRQDIDANSDRHHLNTKQKLIQTGNLIIICLQIVYNIHSQEMTARWVGSSKGELKEPDQFYIWLYELQLKRMQISQP